jgi:hypothetical protein
MSLWKIAGAKVKGPSHVQTGTPCQDAFSSHISPDGQWVSMVVSDGAGSAARAEEGSQLVSQIFSEKLLEIAAQLNTRVPGSWINDFVIQQVIEVRELLRVKAGSDDIRDFHCTLVATLIGPSGGFLIHIGDGSLMGGTLEEEGDEQKTFHFKINVQSKPENGEYANETFFVTEKDWIKHLRITPVGKVDWLILATDGGCALTLKNESSPNLANIESMVEHLLKVPELDRSSSIQRWLDTDGAKQLSNDDKTFVICLHNKTDVYAGQLIKVTNTMVDATAAVIVPSVAAAPIPQAVSTPQVTQAPSGNPGIQSGISPAGIYQPPNKSNPFNLKTILVAICATVIALFAVNFFFSNNQLKTKNPQLDVVSSDKNLETNPKKLEAPKSDKGVAKEQTAPEVKPTSNSDSKEITQDATDQEVKDSNSTPSKDSPKTDHKVKETVDAKHKPKKPTEKN